MRFISLIIIYLLLNDQIFAVSRIKDIVSFQGIRENLLVGYGLVVGLKGTGDANFDYTTKGLQDFLEKLGMSSIDGVKHVNIAAVMVTATLPAFARQGSKLDVKVSTIGDATSLQDGTLIATPLLGADGEIYAIAQGSVSVSGFHTGGNDNATTVSKNATTNAIVSGGAIIEREIEFNLSELNRIKLALNNPDITTSLQIADSINFNIGGNYARAIDPGTVDLMIPKDNNQDMMRFLAKVEQVLIYPDQAAKILIDESSGTIVMGANVRINPVAVAQGNISIVIKNTPTTTQPNPFSLGVTTTNNENDIIVNEEQDNRMMIIDNQVTLGDLVNALNTLGVGPRDLINILHSIKSSGALQASIEVR